MNKLHMETTQITPEKTAMEVVLLLAKAGAGQVVTQYENRELVGLRWTMDVNSQTVPFSMPARVEPVFEIFQKRRNSWDRRSNAKRDQDKAKRVAWRLILRWTQSQLAMIETGMVKTEEVFMPYIEVAPGLTMFDQLVEMKFKALSAPGE